MTQAEQTTQEHIDQLMAQAAQQGEWTTGTHQDFLIGISAAVKETLGISRSFRLPSNAPVDASYRLSPGVPCGTEMAAFDHAIEVDSDPEIPIDLQLIDRAKKICSTCVVQEDCLESAETPPILPLGIFGGKTMKERRPKWEERLDERLAGFRAVYKDVGKKLLDLTQKTDNPDLSKELAYLKEAYFSPLVEESESQPPKVLSESIQRILADRKIVERADLLLPINGRRVLQHWLTAIKGEQDPFDYPSTEARKSNIAAAEGIVGETLTGLHEGTFNYKQWINRGSWGHARRSALVFLCLIGEDIPEGNEAQLIELARQKLSILDRVASSRKKGQKRDVTKIKNLLFDYYGLNGRTVDIEELGMRYSNTPKTIKDNLKKSLALLRSLSSDAQNIPDTNSP